MKSTLPWRGLETWLVVLIALHSYLVGVMLLFFSDWSLSFGGWENPGTFFFTRQGGLFHLIVATGYLMEYFRHRTVSLLVLAKAVAVVFLLAMALLGAPWAALFSAATDGLMLLLIVLVHRQAQRRRDTSKQRRKQRARQAGVI